MSEKYPTKRAYATGKLYKFLKGKGIYKQFAFNCKEDNKICNREKRGFKNYIEIGSAFIWKDTKEGFDFWNEISIESHGEKS